MTFRKLWMIAQLMHLHASLAWWFLTRSFWNCRPADHTNSSIGIPIDFLNIHSLNLILDNYRIVWLQRVMLIATRSAISRIYTCWFCIELLIITVYCKQDEWGFSFVTCARFYSFKFTAAHARERLWMIRAKNMQVNRRFSRICMQIGLTTIIPKADLSVEIHIPVEVVWNKKICGCVHRSNSIIMHILIIFEMILSSDD